jgi:hypothetical protein
METLNVQQQLQLEQKGIELKTRISDHPKIGALVSNGVSLNFFARHVKSFEQFRFAASPMMMLVQVCLGSISVAYALQAGMMDFVFLIITVTMMSNVVVLSERSGRTCVGFFYASILLNISCILAFGVGITF